ncbi:MAG TPA: HAMP domain-containing sensor histidine kinase [Vicinamibacterales bacterium]|nr:HAMP domain-containing sensor histidine kinase [Vicinamibacterales bacterium]
MWTGYRRHPPPWWPAGEPWPPAYRSRAAWRPGRARFFRRLALLAMLVLMTGIGAAIALVSTLAARFGIVTASPAGVLVVVAGALLGALLTSALILNGAMRLLGRPLAAVMDAAARVAEGDYGVRLDERGALQLRGLARAFNTMTGRLADHDRLRRDLMADVAHELRTPLTVVRGRLEGLLDGVYPRDDLQIGELLEETEILSRLIDDLRMLALSEAGTLTLQKEPVDVGVLAADAARAAEDEARARGVTVAVDVPAGLPSIDLDPVRIREVIGNLLTNAIRHTPRGGSIGVRVSQVASAIEIEVRDNGTGMSAEDLARAFDRFHKGDGSRGSGLGLTIARNLARAHGGEIKLASEPDRGTTANVMLPLTRTYRASG